MSTVVACDNQKCSLPESGHCFLNADPVTSCANYHQITDKKKQRKNDATCTSFWSGNYLFPGDLQLISSLSSPKIIGLVGTAKAGKTSYLGMLFTLLLNGKFLHNHFFSGSFTLTAWDKLYFALKFHQGGVLFPEATPANPDFYSLYHMLLSLQNDKRKHVLFADSSGEVFTQWAANKHDENVGSARWINANADGFIFFVDSISLIEKRAEAKETIIDIALRLRQDLGNRPVAIVWSKADKISEIRPNISASLREELHKIFLGKFTEFHVSNYSFTDPDLHCHQNNLEVLNWLLTSIDRPSKVEIEIPADENSGDVFLNYRKK